MSEFGSARAGESASTRVSALSGSTPKEAGARAVEGGGSEAFCAFLASLALSLHLREHADVTTLSHATHHHHTCRITRQSVTSIRACTASQHDNNAGYPELEEIPPAPRRSRVSSHATRSFRSGSPRCSPHSLFTPSSRKGILALSAGYSDQANALRCASLIETALSRPHPTTIRHPIPVSLATKDVGSAN